MHWDQIGERSTSDKSASSPSVIWMCANVKLASIISNSSTFRTVWPASNKSNVKKLCMVKQTTGQWRLLIFRCSKCQEMMVLCRFDFAFTSMDVLFEAPDQTKSQHDTRKIVGFIIYGFSIGSAPCILLVQPYCGITGDLKSTLLHVIRSHVQSLRSRFRFQ